MNLDLLNLNLATFSSVGTLSALTIGLVSLIKPLVTNAKLYPVLSLAVAIGLCLFVLGVSTSAVFAGIIVGLAASGLYDHGSAVVS